MIGDVNLFCHGLALSICELRKSFNGVVLSARLFDVVARRLVTLARPFLRLGKHKNIINDLSAKINMILIMTFLLQKRLKSSPVWCIL